MTINYIFTKNGTFMYTTGDHTKVGNYKVSGGKITFTNIIKVYNNGLKEKYPDTVVEYRFGNKTKNDNGKIFETIELASLDYDKTYLPLSFMWDRFTKMS